MFLAGGGQKWQVLSRVPFGMKEAHDFGTPLGKGVISFLKLFWVGLAEEEPGNLIFTSAQFNE